MESSSPVENTIPDGSVIAKPPVKKVKVVVSDLHLGKGRLLEKGGLNSLEEFYFGEKLVEFIHYYSTGQYKDYEVEMIINGDFLEHATEVGSFDRILMNPPFSKAQDIGHITRAADMLNPGGRLVAICAAGPSPC